MIVLAGPSASGKTEVAKLLESKYGLSKVVTCTTRPKRVYEIDGVDYHFLTEDEFNAKLKRNEFLETTFYNNYYYGTLISDLKLDSVVVLDPDGINSIYKTMKDEVTIIVLSTSEDVRRSRMIERMDEVDEVNKRINYDSMVFNPDNFSHIDYIIDTSTKSIDDVASVIYGLAKTPKQNA